MHFVVFPHKALYFYLSDYIIIFVKKKNCFSVPLSFYLSWERFLFKMLHLVDCSSNHGLADMRKVSDIKWNCAAAATTTTTTTSTSF